MNEDFYVEVSFVNETIKHTLGEGISDIFTVTRNHSGYMNQD